MARVQIDSAQESEAPKGGLHSVRSMQRLEQIAQLRARGIGNHIALPQLVVCGDQSAGKSSVLEGLTEIPFPRQDGLCTTFPTEIIMQHQPGDYSIKASVIASKLRSSEEKSTFEQYHAELQDFLELPEVIKKVSELFGIRQPGSESNGPAFVEDVLRIEYRGPHGLHLSVVDLPGLISVPNDDQTDADVQTVHSLVDSYVADDRTIILAVVQAGNDIANQAIVRKSRTVDHAGERTVGIITKPDLINKTSEKRIALLAANKDTTKLKLGFFLVKNPNPTELAKGVTPEERHKNEIQYFQSSPWKEQSLDPDRTGILALRGYLQRLLDKHIERELPKVREDIRKLLLKTEDELGVMGEERSDVTRMRSFLTRQAMDFHSLCTSALNGTYDDGVFFDVGKHQDSHRLRANVQFLNSKFADVMRCKGAKRKIVSETEPGNDSADDSESDMERQEKVTEKGMKLWIKQVYRHSRGKELPGTFNYVLLGELFREQASPWLILAVEHVHEINYAIDDFVHVALEHVVKDENVREELNEIVNASLRANLKKAMDELDKLWEDERQQPITYNHYFTDNIQKARQHGTQTIVQNAIDQTRDQDYGGKLHVSNINVDLEKLMNGVCQRVEVNMEEQACNEALSGLKAYYKVTMKTFVDNLCRQVLERHLLRPLPKIFCPEAVAAMNEDELARIAQETEDLTAKRSRLQALREDLVISLQDLKKGKGSKTSS